MPPLYRSILIGIVALVAASHAGAQLRYTPVAIPTRDGRSLAADLYASDTTVRRPTILVQTPYNKLYYRLATVIPPEAGGSFFPLDTLHYNYVVVDWRGFYGSKEAAVANYDRGLDGYDAVEWIAAQGWSDGKVGTWGASALGQIQFLTAKQHPPHLVCSLPLVKDFKTKYTDFYYGGIYRKEHVESEQALGFFQASLILSRPTDDVTWSVVERGSDYPDSIAVPMLLISGWYDHFPDDVIRAFDDLRARSAPAVRGAHRLMMGPWMHSEVGKSQQGILSYPNAEGVSDSIALRFFDRYLRGIDNGYELTPPVTYYQMGTNVWRTTGDWHAVCRSADTLSLYLAPGGALERAPRPDEKADTLPYDPRNPSPTVGGARLVPFGTNVLDGPRDMRDTIEGRSDVLVYSTPPLDRDLEVTGGVTITLHLSSNRKDTDIGARLCDVYPDGRSVLLTQGIRRLRFRAGLRPQDTALMIPGTTYQVAVELQNIAMTFMKGHRLRIDLSSSNFPQYDLNPNSGGPLYTPGDTLVATNLIHTGGATLSRVTMPVAAGASAVPVVASSASGARLDRAIPNPVTTSATIGFAVPERCHVTLDLHDLLGRTVATLLDGIADAGEHTATIDASTLTPGLYLYRLVTPRGAVSSWMVVGR
jgi:predicted acyl esterase